MPIQEANKKAKTNDEFMQNQEQENTATQDIEPEKKNIDLVENKKKNLILTVPSLATKHDKIEMKIAKLQDKSTKLTNKINKNKDRIADLTNKKSKAIQTAERCEALIESAALPAAVNQFLKSLAESKRNKVINIDEKISDRQKKNTVIQDKISKNEIKITKQNQKLKRIERIDKFISNMHSSEGRKENFINGLQEFRQWSLERNQNKLDKIDKKIEDIQNSLSTDKIWSTEKIKLNDTLKTYQVKRENIEEKIEKLNSMNENLKAVDLLPVDKTERVITSSCENIANALANKQLTVAQTVDTVLDTADKTVETLLEKIQNLEAKIDNLEKTNKEQQVTDSNDEKPKSIEDKLKIDIDNDLMFFGEITFDTVQAIKQAGYVYENGNLQPAVTEAEIQDNKNAIEKSENTKTTNKSASKSNSKSKDKKRVSPLSKEVATKNSKIISEKTQQQEHKTSAKEKENELS